MNNMLNAQLAKVRAADAAHDEVMTRVAARGGLTLDQLRALSMQDKDVFFAQYGDHRQAQKAAE